MGEVVGSREIERLGWNERSVDGVYRAVRVVSGESDGQFSE